MKLECPWSQRSAVAAMVILVCFAVHARAFAWTISTVDGPGDVGAYASMSLDPGNNPAISYCDAGNDNLKFARLVGGVWQVETVDATGRTGWYTSLAFDAAGYPRIAYWDLTNSALRYARWNGTAWLKETVDNAAYVGQCCSLALETGSGNPSISYYDYTGGDLKYAHWNGAAWQIEVVDDGAPLLGAGLYTSLALDGAGHPHISYAEHTQGQLRYATWNGTSWTLQVVDGGTPIGTSIRLDSDGIPHISYAYQFGQGSHLKYAARTGPGGTWQTQIVRLGGQFGWYSSLCLRSDNSPCILSWDLGGGIVDYDSYDAGVWVHDTIESMGFTDQWCSLALDSAGQPLAAYRSATQQDLHYAVGLSPAAVPDDGRSDLTADARPIAPIRLIVSPNPANEHATAGIQLSRPGTVRLHIFDVLGREAAPPVERVVSGEFARIPLPSGLKSGVYLLRAETPGGAQATTQMIRAR